MNKKIEKGSIHEPKKNPFDPRKTPRPGYDEKNPTKEDGKNHPEEHPDGKSKNR